ncbi:MAG: MFS transporter [Bryobacteraceae bacterium]|nr:MFS transporter [Bryobacteraceae bacterium]MDW8380325.1 MFS transporter [Bryobacterales bacterium]
MTPTRRWTIVVLLSLGMIIAYIDRANLSVALAADDFKQFFRLSDQDRGVLNSAFFWSYALLQIPAGFVVDRFGVKIPYALGFLFWSLTSTATAVATAVWQLHLLRLLLGVGEAVVTPASLRWLRFNVEEHQRGLAVGIYMAGTKYGPAIGTPLAGFLTEMYGWRMMFAILGLGCLVWLIPWLTLVKNDDRELEAAALKKSTSAPVSFGRIFSTRLIWGIITGTFCYNYFVYFCLTWMPSYLKESRGLSLSGSSLYTGFSFGGMATVAILAGLLADRLIARGGDAVKVRKAFTIAGLSAASSVIGGAFLEDNRLALALAICSLSGLGLATANYWALTQTLMPGAAIGRIAGVQNCASNLSGIVAAIFTGWLKQTTGSYAAPILAVGILLIVGVCAYIFLVDPKYAPQAKA